MISFYEKKNPDNHELIEYLAEAFYSGEGNRRIRKVARRFGINENDFEDTIQDSILSIWRRNYQNPDFGLSAIKRIDTWFMGVFRRRCIDYLRRQRTRKGIEKGYIEKNNNRVIESCEEKVLKDEDEEDVRRKFNKIDEKFKEVMVKYYFQKLSYREISNELGLPVGTVKSRISRGLDILRDSYDNRVLV